MATQYHFGHPLLSGVAGNYEIAPSEAVMNARRDFHAWVGVGALPDTPVNGGWRASTYTTFDAAAANERCVDDGVAGSCAIQMEGYETGCRLHGPTLATPSDGTYTVIFQKWWGDGHGPRAWDGPTYGYPPAPTRVSVGAHIAVPENGGGGVGYSTLFIRGRDTLNNKRYWIQASMFDERGDLPESVYMDPYTGECALSSQIRPGGASYYAINPDSHHMASSPFGDYRFFCIEVTRQNLWDLIERFNTELGAGLTPEPNWHEVIAVGMTPEIGADTGFTGVMSWKGRNLFLRTDY